MNCVCKQLCILALCLVVAGCGARRSAGQADSGPKADLAQQVVDKSVRAMEDFMKRDPDHGVAFLVENAAGIMIFPSVGKVGFVAAFEGGTGVACAHTDRGWSYPSFMALSGASVGLQAGIKGGAVVLVFLSRELFEDALAGGVSYKLRGGLTIWNLSDGNTPWGLTRELDTVLLTDWDGFYAGASLGGAGLAGRTPLNEAYYGVNGIDAGDILFHSRHVNFGADSLRGLLDSMHLEQNKKDGMFVIPSS